MVVCVVVGVVDHGRCGSHYGGVSSHVDVVDCCLLLLMAVVYQQMGKKRKKKKEKRKNSPNSSNNVFALFGLLVWRR